MNPLIRGRCTSCGYSRNLWVTELPALPDIDCDHVEMCHGRMEVAYAGPKAFMSKELDRAHQVCACSERQAACGAGASRNEDVSRLCEMGFAEDAVKQALAEVDARGDCGAGRTEAALDRLMSLPSKATAQCGTCNSSSPAEHPGMDACVCAICTEDMEPANAAMRCSGQHGKRHYYHAHCLSQWIQQCRRDNQAPTCPECRGELQVRARRLQEFLSENSRKLSREDMEALRAVHDAAMSESDGDGWSGIKTETVLKGLAVGAGVAVAGLALAAALGAFSGKRDDRDRR